MADERAHSALFEGVHFAIVPGGAIDDVKEPEVGRITRILIQAFTDSNSSGQILRVMELDTTRYLRPTCNTSPI